MYKVLSKGTIELEIVPYIPVGKRGFKSNCILYKLKTGIQWYLLPILQLFSKEVLHYKTVFGYYRKWCKAGIWKACWSSILQKNRSKIDFVDGSHTTALRDGEAVGYQDRKNGKRNSEIYNDHYFDHQLHKERYAIERTNAWLDSFRSILNRFDTSITSWIGFNYLAFIVIAMRKFQKIKSR